MHKLTSLLLLAGVIIFNGCSTSKKSSAESVKSYNKVFVEVATVDVEVRNEVETAIVMALKADGYAAVKSLDVIPFSLKELKLPTKEEVELKVKEHNCDAILIVSLSKTGESVNYTPGVSQKENTQFLASLLRDIVTKTSYPAPEPADIKAVETQGSYSKRSAVFFLHGNFFDAETQQAVFTNQSAGIDINEINKSSKVYAVSLIAELKKERLLRK